MLTFTDEASRKIWVLFSARKDLQRLFIEWKNIVELEIGFRFIIIRCNNILEFKVLAVILALSGVKFEFISFYLAW
jgi:hypothetical protein